MSQNRKHLTVSVNILAIFFRKNYVKCFLRKTGIHNQRPFKQMAGISNPIIW